MKVLLRVSLLLLMATRVQAQALPIHQHPQKAVYASPAEWPTPPWSSQCHWPRVPGADPSLPMTHLHVDPTVPLYAELNGPQTFTVTVGLFNTTGRILDAQAVAGWHDGGNTGSISLPPLTGQLNQFVTVTGSFTVTPPIPHGWYWISVDVRALMEDGSVVTTRARRPAYSTVDISQPEVTYGGWIFTECNFSSAADPNNDHTYGQQVAELDFLASERGAPFIPVPVLPLAQVWPMYMSSFGYASSFTDVDTAETRFVLDPDYHHNNPGTTLESVSSVHDVSHVPMIFNQTGTHKYAVIRDLMIPEVGEHIMALLVGTVTGNADMSPVPQPFPLPIVDQPPPPPPPPPPPAETFTTVCTVQFQAGSAGHTQTVSSCPSH
jgi:hypothetical protein